MLVAAFSWTRRVGSCGLGCALTWSTLRGGSVCWHSPPSAGESESHPLSLPQTFKQKKKKNNQYLSPQNHANFSFCLALAVPPRGFDSARLRATPRAGEALRCPLVLVDEAAQLTEPQLFAALSRATGPWNRRTRPEHVYLFCGCCLFFGDCCFIIIFLCVCVFVSEYMFV